MSSQPRQKRIDLWQMPLERYMKSASPHLPQQRLTLTKPALKHQSPSLLAQEGDGGDGYVRIACQTQIGNRGHLLN